MAFVLIAGSQVRLQSPEPVIDLAISGLPGVETDKPKPPEIMPELPTIEPPPIEISDAIDENLEATPGMANVTAPAQAIADAHGFPKAPASYRAKAPLTVKLVLSITEAGSISMATVQSSCGIESLDVIAVDWVKTHWRYRPALRNGIPMAVETTAIVTFVSG